MLSMSFTWKGETRFNLVLDAQMRWRRKVPQKEIQGDFAPSNYPSTYTPFACLPLLR